MAVKLYQVKGPGGKCIVNKEQANALVSRDGYELVGRFDPRRERLKQESKKDERVKEESEKEIKESGIMDEFNDVKSKKDLAEFLDKYDGIIEVDPATYDGFYELRAGVKEKIEEL